MCTGMRHLQLTSAQDMQIAEAGAGVEVRVAAQNPGVVQLGLHTEAFENAGQAVNGGRGPPLNELVCLIYELNPMVRAIS